MDELFENCVKKQWEMSWSTVCLRKYFWMIFLPFAIQAFGQSEKNIVVIDPGHGGSDSGAVGIHGIREKDVVLKIAFAMVRLNEAISDSSLEIYLTRYSDTLISLKDRTNLAKALQADLFISLHCNQANNPNTKGSEVFVSSTMGPFLRQSILVGYEIEKILTTKIGLKSRGVKFSNFQVLRETVISCPAVLIELGFLSNWDEAEYLQKKGNQLSVSAFILRFLKGLL